MEYEHENIRVRCLHCSRRFTTSLDAFGCNEAYCPDCGYANLVAVLPEDE
jgi:DNA-directed RNA polymerase subunit RPC12/RpoP